MRYLSLFSGIEAATVAWKPLGWECVAVAEIEPFPCKLLEHHYPNVPNLGDITQIKSLGRIDLVVFGSPCQDLSIAGLRKGFDDGTRSSLFFNAIRLIQWARQHGSCRFAIWENVYGAFSSNEGRDFASVVAEMAGLSDVRVPKNGWGSEGCAYGDNGMLEWSVLDAQWFGVAQRRRRVFAVADFGDWQHRPPILLERRSLRGDTAPSREAREGVTYDVAPCLTSSGRGVERTGETRGQDPVVAVEVPTSPVCAARMVAFGEYVDDGTASTMKQRDYKDATDLVTYGIPGNWIGRKPENGGNAVEPMHGVAPCLTSADRHGVAYSVALRGRDGGATAELGGEVAGCLRASTGGGDKPHVLAPIAFSSKDYGGGAAFDIAPTLRSGNHDKSHANGGQPPAIAFDSRQDPVSSTEVFGALGSSSPQAQAVCITGDITHTLKAEGFDASEDGTGRGHPIVPAVPEIAGTMKACKDSGGWSNSADHAAAGYMVPTSSMAVRRLTPRECERLQGFPDQYTLIPIKGKPAADGPRYKALGNSMAVPVMRWIGQQINAAINI